MAAATLFIYFYLFQFHTFIIIFIQYIHPLSISSLLVAQREKPPWGADPRFVLGPAKHQASALPTELRCTLTELRFTLTELHCTLNWVTLHLNWATLHPWLTYARPNWARLHHSWAMLYPSIKDTNNQWPTSRNQHTAIGIQQHWTTIVSDDQQRLNA